MPALFHTSPVTSPADDVGIPVKFNLHVILSFGIPDDAVNLIVRFAFASVVNEA